MQRRVAMGSCWFVRGAGVCGRAAVAEACGVPAPLPPTGLPPIGRARACRRRRRSSCSGEARPRASPCRPGDRRSRSSARRLGAWGRRPERPGLRSGASARATADGLLTAERRACPDGDVAAGPAEVTRSPPRGYDKAQGDRLPCSTPCTCGASAIRWPTSSPGNWSSPSPTGFITVDYVPGSVHEFTAPALGRPMRSASRRRTVAAHRAFVDTGEHAVRRRLMPAGACPAIGLWQPVLGSDASDLSGRHRFRRRRRSTCLPVVGPVDLRGRRCSSQPSARRDALA